MPFSFSGFSLFNGNTSTAVFYRKDNRLFRYRDLRRTNRRKMAKPGRQISGALKDEPLIVEGGREWVRSTK